MQSKTSRSKEHQCKTTEAKLGQPRLGQAKSGQAKPVQVLHFEMQALLLRSKQAAVCTDDKAVAAGRKNMRGQLHAPL